MFYSGVYKTITQLTREVRRVYGTTLEKAASDGYGLKPRTTMAQKPQQRVSFGGGAAAPRAVVTANEDDAPLATPPPAVKRPAPSTEEPPGSAKRANVEEEEVPTFKMSKWDFQPWRTGFVSEVVLEDYADPLPTSQSDHILRIYHHASKKHQETKCAATGNCVWCRAAGTPNFFKGNPDKKSVPHSLYVEAIKTYTLVDEDFDVEFHDASVDAIKSYGEDLEVLDFNEFFMENCLQMRYCAQCYPEVSAAVEAMSKFFQAPFAVKTSMSVVERRQALEEFNTKKATMKKEFVAKLREVSICSHFDWVLHLQSNKHNHKKNMNIDDLPQEVDGLHQSVVAVKNQILQLELVFKNQMEDLMRRMAEKPTTPKVSQHMLMSETEQFAEALLHPTGNFKQYLSKLFGELSASLTASLTTNLARNITEVVNSVRANSVNIQGLTCDIQKVPESIKNSLQPVVETLTGFEERLGKIEEVMKNQLEGK
jgi:hypothetical protein